MGATGATSAQGDVVCPDPSAHAKDASHHDEASKAAAIASSPGKSSSGSKRDVNILGPDGKLSAAGAATSLKYAKPEELPSYPSVGIDTVNSGHTAAHLANANKKSIETWKPDASSSASKAALRAQKDGGKLEMWHPEASKAGQSAAGAAMSKQKGLSPQLDYGYTESGKRSSMSAAAKSVSDRNNPAPPPSKPNLYPDADHSAYNARNAAAVANRSSPRNSNDTDRMSSDAMEAARVKHHHMSREMFTEHPPVAIEVEEKRHHDALRASAVSMAKQMMDVQQRQSAETARSEGDLAAKRASKHQSLSSTGTEDIKIQAMHYMHLQEAAQKLAAERLAKLDPEGINAYREHYGYNTTPNRHRLSLRSRGKRRTSQDEDEESSEDEVRAGRIRHQMRNFNKEVESVDDKKKAADRSNLMAAAEARVQARLHDMDERVFAETGHVSPAMMQEWEAKARAKAASDSEQRMLTHGKVHIGGGKYMDQSEIDAIAAGRMQPTLDEINDTAEKLRAKEEEARLDQERLQFERAQEKQRDKEVKAELKRAEDEKKQAAREEKQAEKSRIAEEKAVQKEEKRQQKAEKISEATLGTTSFAGVEVPETTTEHIPETVDEPGKTIEGVDIIGKIEPEPGTEEAERAATSIEVPTEAADEPVEVLPGPAKISDVIPDGPATPFATEKVATETPTSKPQRRESKLRGFLGKLKRGSKKGDAKNASEDEPVATSSGLETAKPADSGGLYSASDKDVTLGHSELTEPSEQKEKKSPSPSLDTEPAITAEETEYWQSQVIPGKEKEEDDVEEARDTFDDKLEPPASSLHKESLEGSPARTGSKFHEEV